MTTRYKTTSNIRTNALGKNFFGTRIYPVIPQQQSDILYITNETDYLDTLAYKFYKDKSLWWIIANANQLGTGRLSVPVGIQIRIPMELDGILSDYYRINS